MRRYVQVSGALFGLIAAAQLTRTVLGWPAQVGEITIPVWWSGVAFLVTSTFAFWAWRTARSAA